MENEDNEIVPDDLDDSVVEEEYSKDKVKSLKEKLKEAEGKAKEYLDGWQRSQAEFVNVRKRDEESRLEFLKFAKADLILELLPVLDSFHLALGHGSKDLEPIYKQLLQVLKQSGLEEINPIGEEFDPREHEAISTRDGEENKILEVHQKGYILSGKIIRPAKVSIGAVSETK